MSQDKARRILDLVEEGYTAEQISLATGCDPRSVADVVESLPNNLTQDERGSYVERKSSRVRARCKTCGLRVYKPCMLCRQRRIGAVAPEPETEAGPLPGDPTVDEIWRMAATLRSLRKEQGKGKGYSPGIRQYWTSDLTVRE